MFHKRIGEAPLFKKLRGRSGSTLLEVIISILIFSMATLGFYQMVFVSVSINRAAGASDVELENQRIIAESHGTYKKGAIHETPATLQVSAGGVSKTITVQLYGADGNAPLSYKLP